ncbi:protein-disulfide reductase DsbD domain-containing protein, partial [Pseudoxanthomonas kalamensis]|uniref:protein-disulfide reductase DsbD domain-containing protein n=1 Tax=Pseudoxanthomonas kalamensis TaxID=289483 RepID=UPI0024836326
MSLPIRPPIGRPRLPRRLQTLILLACSLLPLPALAVDEGELLPVDEAFVISAQAPSRDRIEIRWRIHDGYYLYRHRTQASTDAAFQADELQLPAGTPHQDEFFGAVETYRGQLQGVLQGQAAPGAERVSLTLKYQGCADAGICYPPQTRKLEVQLPPATTATESSGSLLPGGSGSGLPLLGAAAGTNALPLPAEQAFVFEAIPGDSNTVLMRFTPARGYYLYRDRSDFKVSGDSGIRAGTPQWPPGRSHRDEHFGDVVVYFDAVDVPLPLQRTHASAAEVQVTATFQGCQNEGICYPPMTRTVAVSLPAGNGAPPPDAVPAPPSATQKANTAPGKTPPPKYPPPTSAPPPHTTHRHPPPHRPSLAPRP